MEQSLVYAVIFLAVFAVGNSQTQEPIPPFDSDVCSLQNRASEEGFQDCLGAIRYTMQDINAFWFGLDYPARCPEKENTIECQNFRPNPTSMADRLFPFGTFEASTINSYLDIVIHEKPGRYEGCGNEYVTENTFNHTLDPISPEPLTPWQSSHGFSASIQGLQDSRRGVKYTLIIIDGGFSFLHGVYIDIPGDASMFDYTKGKEIDPYHGPQYYKNDPLNPYVFLVFRQQRSFRGVLEPWVARLIKLQGLQGQEPMKADIFSLGDFLNPRKLTGPVAVNWLMSSTDAYAAQIQLDNGIVNVCPVFVAEAARTLESYHIPADASFDVTVDVTYLSEAMNFTLCCINYSYGDSYHRLNPIGNGELTPFQVRSAPYITLIKQTIMPSTADFIGELYTLLLIDPDWPEIYSWAGTTTEPLALWLTTNIRFGRVGLGRTILPYFQPEGHDHRYEFLLYKQTERLQVNASDFGQLCPGTQENPRCRFNVDRFVTQSNLTLAGASWFIGTTSEAYIDYWILQNGWISEEDICVEVPGYGNPCPAAGQEETGNAEEVLRDDSERKDGGRIPSRDKPRRERSTRQH